MRGLLRNIAISLALFALAATGVAGTAEAKGGGGKLNAAAVKMSRGAQIRLNRMTQKMSLRPRGTLQQKTRRQLRIGKRKMVRAMSRRERTAPTRVQLMRASSRRDVGLDGSEAERTRARFARNVGDSPSTAGDDVVGGYGPRGDKDREQNAALASPDVTQEHLEESSSAKQRKKMRDKVRKATTPPKKKIPKRRRD